MSKERPNNKRPPGSKNKNSKWEKMTLEFSKEKQNGNSNVKPDTATDRGVR